MDVFTGLIDGLELADVNPSGPLQEYVTDGAVPVSPENRLTVPPLHA
jgi:hypothetical protein